MSAFVMERGPDGTITVAPRLEQEQSALVIITHGLGDTAEGFADVAELMAKEMPYVKFILPTAPRQPVTMNMGMEMPSWYDIVGLDERSNENCPGIEESAARIRGYLQAEHEATGLSYQRMLLAGFSQGGALSLFTGLQMPESAQRLAGIVCLSGYLPAASKFKLTPGLESTPVWHGHGRQDMVVAYGLADKTAAAVRAAGVQQYTVQSYSFGHTVSMDEIRDAMAFVRRVLPPDDTCRIRVPDPADMSIKELKAAIRRAGLSNQAVGFMEKQEFVRLLQDYRQGKL